MATYRTMTLGGVYGPSIDAVDDTDAIASIEESGFETVLDVIEHDGELTLVVEG